MKLNKKKGFTIIELVIVIAVIGVLTAILVPVFVNLTARANEASDQSLVKNLNTALKMEEQAPGHVKAQTLQGAIDDLEKQGFLLENLVAKSGQDLLWNQPKNEFVLNKNGSYSGKDYWQIVDLIPNTQKYSYYAGSNYVGTTATVNYGFDAGQNASFTSIKYSGSTGGQLVNIRTIGDQCKLEIDAENDDVNFYGFARELTVTNVKNESLHIHGSANQLALKSGHVVVEDEGIVFDVVQFGEKTTAPGATATAIISNKGYIADTTFSKHDSVTPEQVEAAKVIIDNDPETTKDVGGDYGIETLAQLEAFRDAVNSGNTFVGRKVKLLKDITLNDGWKPIGEASRKPSSTASPSERNSGLHTGNVFRGEFDGNNKTISNLNNKGFVPTLNRLGEDGSVYQYAYGLFGIVGTGLVLNNNQELVAGPAKIYNLTLKDVDIDTTRYTKQYNGKSVNGDSVGALAGYIVGSVTISGITVENGSVKAYEAVAGIVGRAYPFSDEEDKVVKTNAIVTISGCTNHAAIEATSRNCAGILGFANTKQSKITINGNSSTASPICPDSTNKANIANVQREAASGVAGVLTYNNEEKAVGSYHFN